MGGIGISALRRESGGRGEHVNVGGEGPTSAEGRYRGNKAETRGNIGAIFYLMQMSLGPPPVSSG